MLKFELMIIRLVGLGMPLAYVKGDIEQGFPSARNMLLLAAAWRAGVPDRDLIQLQEEMRDRPGRVRMGTGTTPTYQMDEGTEQGRRRSPPLYCAMVRALAEGALSAGPGVGLDVDPEAATVLRSM